MKQLAQIISVAFFSVFTFSLSAQHVAIANAKMNVVYIGVDNPIDIAVSGQSMEKISVKVSSGEISGNSGKYIWRVSTPGKGTVSVSVNGKEISSQDFRIKRIPDPVATIGKKMSGSLTVGEIKAQDGITAVLANFDFDAYCEIQSFSMTVVPKNGDPIDTPNKGGKFERNAKNLIRNLQPGSIIYIENIKCRCPGDKSARKINSIVIKVK